MADVQKITGGADRKTLSIALLGADDQRRMAVAGALSARPGVRIREFNSFPSDLAQIAPTLAQSFDVVIVDVDDRTDFVFALIESICSQGRACVMAYSGATDMKLAVRFMRAGVRDFFTLPIDAAEVASALARVSARSVPARPASKTASKVFVFLGAKGGCGVTTIASNFALALSQESGRGTLLVDLGLPLGDVSINLGMVTEYSVATALQDFDRLDSNFLSSIVAQHSSGLSVLAAPGEFTDTLPPREAIDKLAAVMRQSYECVVVDIGSRIDLIGSPLFDDSTVYLVTQVGITELRNANRMITQFFADYGNRLQIVLNRYTAKALLFDDAQIAKTLTRPAQWKIPDDYAAARRIRNTATPIALVDSPIANAIREMARAAAGLPADRDEKKSIFRLRR